MFGIYRYCLAFCVAISHLWGGMIGGPAAYAVWGFYCLSGYLMTLILNEKYGFSPRGLAKFAVNRALRIYPAYYVVCAGMFVLFYFVPGTSAKLLPNLHMPRTGQGWCYSLLLMTPPDGHALLHGSSALRVELWFYVAIALGLGRNRRMAAAWFITSVAYTLWLLAHRTPFPERYVYIPACSLAFSLGSLVYHVRDRLPVIKTLWAALSAASLWWLHVWVTQNIPGGPWIVGLYSSLLFSVFAMVTLMRLEPKALPDWMGKVDRFAGNLSYPMYLCHWGVGILVIWFLPGKTRVNLSVFLIAFPVVNVVSYLICFVERPLQSWKLTGQVQPRPAVATARHIASAAGLVHAAHPVAGPQPPSRRLGDGQGMSEATTNRLRYDVRPRRAHDRPAGDEARTSLFVRLSRMEGGAQTAVQVTPQFRDASARPGTDHAAERSLPALRTPSIRCLAISSIC